ERSAPGIQVCALHRGAVVRTFSQAKPVSRRRHHMSSRFITTVTRASILAGILTVVGLPVTIAGQAGAAATPKPAPKSDQTGATAAAKPPAKPAAKAWTPTRTPWGDP